MKRFFSAFLLAGFFFLSAAVNVCMASSPDEIRALVRADFGKASGLDGIISFDTPAATPAPQGYKPFYISHYGRHGSRYAYSSGAYTTLLDMLRKAGKQDNLTPYGKELLARLDSFYENAQYHVGDLTSLGWNQHKRLAEVMVNTYPDVFADGASVDAVVSTSARAMISMSSFCLSLAQMRPSLPIYEHQGLMEVQATAPNMGRNPLRYKGPDMPFPYAETPEQFFRRRFPDWKNVYGRMFDDPDKVIGKGDQLMDMDDIYMLVSGMQSLPEDVRSDFSDIFTADEYVKMWEADNYLRFFEYYKYITPCCSIVDDIVRKADERLEGRGADLRFGHDHVLMSLYMLMDIEGYGNIPADNDELIRVFQTYSTPMATNLQFVFYRKDDGNGDILVKLMHNGVESSLGNLETVTGPYYRWTDLRAFLKGRVAKFSWTKEQYQQMANARKAAAKPVENKVAPIWKRDTISQGYVYHNYCGYDPISDAMQNVNVLEIDMNNPRYSVKFDCFERDVTTSYVASRRKGTVGAINGAYEPASVFIRVDGKTYFDIPNSIVMNTGVPQWRNDGGIYCDADGRNVKIEAAGMGRSLKATRKAYARRARKWDNILTSAPVLINDYVPVGETFAEKGLSDEELSRVHYEAPLSHQHVRHPRTAVATSGDNRLFLVTVDGRWPGFSAGMNACELTKFLAKHFNPRYALNLDGGGSTTMIVDGRGDEFTNVVNYPTDNKALNHSGQRSVRTHICIVDSQKQ